MSQHDLFLRDYERFEQLLNESSNGANYVYGVDYTVDQPSINSTTPGYNTRVNVTSLKPNSAPIPVVYNRLNPGVINDILADNGNPPIYPLSTPFSTQDILSRLFSAVNLNIQSHEFINQTYNDPVETIDITFTGNSLVWQPGSVTVNIIPSSARITEGGDIRITESGDIRITEMA